MGEIAIPFPDSRNSYAVPCQRFDALHKFVRVRPKAFRKIVEGAGPTTEKLGDPLFGNEVLLRLVSGRMLADNAGRRMEEFGKES